MLKIGEFSSLTGIPVKTLRYYAEIGLLNPLYIDSSSYRYYGLEQLFELNRIIELKDIGFKLSEISGIREKAANLSDLLCIYKSKLSAAEKERQFIDVKIANIQAKISEITEKEQIKMIIKNLHQEPYNSTLLGTVKAAADFYSVTLSLEMLYGLTGHAFMINIHDQLCTSGPYCYKLDVFCSLLLNAGIEMTDCGFYHEGSTIEERKAVEDKIISHLKFNNPCSLVNMEYQMIYGYDETGFITAQPWSIDFPPKHLTFNTWSEIQKEIHVNFFIFTKVKQEKDMNQMVKEALNSAVEMNTMSDKYTSKPYYTGTQAYDTFVKALKNGYGKGNGNRWNATVWGECRNMASGFFKELSGIFPDMANELLELSHSYKLVGEGLVKISNASLPIELSIKVLEEIKVIEEQAVGKIKILIDKF